MLYFKDDNVIVADKVFDEPVHVLGHNIVFDRCRFLNVDNALRLDGYGCIVNECHFENIDIAVLMYGECNTVQKSVITNFKEDGIRISGSGSRSLFNRISDFQPDGEIAHHDGIQLYRGNPATPANADERFLAKYVLEDIHIIGNVINDYPATTLQGITCFDGLLKNIKIVNNQVNINSDHSITLLGLLEDSGNQISGNNISNGKIILKPARRLLNDKWITLKEGCDELSGLDIVYHKPDKM